MSDAFPLDPCASSDIDSDGMPDSIDGPCLTGLVLDPDIDGDGVENDVDWRIQEIEDNGIRETDANYRREIDEEIQKLLLKHRPIVHTLKGSTEERIEQILKTI